MICDEQRADYDEACARIFDLLEKLDALDILRSHVPTRNRWLFDRLETTLRLADRILAGTDYGEDWVDVDYDGDNTPF
jgi:hypothetical protein